MRLSLPESAPRLLLAAFALIAFGTASLSAQKNAAKPLTIYAVDVEGGQATLLVTPGGESLLVDTGWPTDNDRDALRIQAAMNDAGIQRLDHVLVTHFHTDHVAGVPGLLRHVEVGEFIDHGVNREDSDVARRDFAAYLKAIEGRKRRIAKLGDEIGLKGVSAVIVAGDGEDIARVSGVEPKANPLCATEPKWDLDATENPRSMGFLLRFGSFRFLDLGDLTKAREIPLVCPANLLGQVDLYLVNHHGFYQSNSLAFVHALAPRVAIMNNGAHKGGSPEAWQTIHSSPGLEDLWMLHTSEDADTAHNSPEPRIANLKGGTDGAWLKVTAHSDGSFAVSNGRSGETKQYGAR